VLSGPNPVFRWISGTGARPVLQALPEHHREQFVSEYQELLNNAYPTRFYGTVLPFRRIFVVAHRAPQPRRAGGSHQTQPGQAIADEPLRQ
jgi:trans-aconitate 2-methyltransferase